MDFPKQISIRKTVLNVMLGKWLLKSDFQRHSVKIWVQKVEGNQSYECGKQHGTQRGAKAAAIVP